MNVKLNTFSIQQFKTSKKKTNMNNNSMNNTNSKSRSRLNVTTTNKDAIIAADTDIRCSSNNFFSMQQQQQIIQLEGLDRTITLQLKHLEFHHQEILKQRRPIKPKPIPIKATTNNNKKKIAVTTMNSIIMVPPAPDSNTSSHDSFIKWASTNPLYDDDIKLIVSPKTSSRHRHRHRVVNRTMDADTDTGEDEDDYYELVFQRECVA